MEKVNSAILIKVNADAQVVLKDAEGKGAATGGKSKRTATGEA